MRNRWKLLTTLPLVGFAACGSEDETPPVFRVAAADAGIEPEVEQGVDAPIGACQPGECCVEGSLPDKSVRVLLKTASCDLVRGRSVHFDIGLEITKDLTVDEAAIPKGTPGWLSSSLTSAATEGASHSLALEIRGPSDDDHYCVCDVGNAPRAEHFLHVVKATSHYYPFTWSGRRYGGPSDTGQAEGALFGVGPASLIVTFVIDDATQLPVSLPFTVVAAP